ncbi:MAG: Hsp20/alpha crystallin family protein, partial [Candidatus Pacearchaeota archaeon]|nr:Hsp20/alpha crystallin family protein [Candidatus Pacearchaeota archaeon]
KVKAKVIAIDPEDHRVGLSVKAMTETTEKKKKAKKEDAEESMLAETKDELSKEEGELAVDLYQTDEEIIVQSAVAGVKPEDLEVSIENDLVTIRGDRSEYVAEEKKDYFYQECFWGTFSREIILPEEVDANAAEASFRDGVLTIRLPKSSRHKKKKIKIKG